jgi:hypothetical protein
LSDEWKFGPTPKWSRFSVDGVSFLFKTQPCAR